LDVERHLNRFSGGLQMNTAKILITGATGDTGGYAIEQLLHKGHQVRALVHRIDDRSQRLEDKGVEVVAGDYLDLDAMRAAVQGVRRAYFVYPIRPGIIQATAYFAQAAREAGLEAVVNMSQISARENARSHAARDHWVAERGFDWSGTAVTHQSNTRSATQWSRAAWLLASSRAEICDMFTSASTPASFAAWAKYAVPWMIPGRIG